MSKIFYYLQLPNNLIYVRFSAIGLYKISTPFIHKQIHVNILKGQLATNVQSASHFLDVFKLVLFLSHTNMLSDNKQRSYTITQLTTAVSWSEWAETDVA